MKFIIALGLLLSSISLTNHVLAAEVDLIDVERKLAAAVLALDFDTLDDIYAEDFVFTHMTGDVDTRLHGSNAFELGDVRTLLEALIRLRSKLTAMSRSLQAGFTRNRILMTRDGMNIQFGAFAFIKCKTVDGDCSVIVRFERSQVR